MQSEPVPLKRLSIAMPASVASDTPHLREQTAKLGAIARACSIFGVNEIILYPEDARRRQEAEMDFCSDILEYLETPQYLRKRIYKLNPTFKFTGILPPIQAPHHNLPRTMAGVKIGDIREGVIISRNGSQAIVDVGLERFASVAAHKSVNDRVTVRLIGLGKNPRGEIVEPSVIRIHGPDKHPMYWGYRVHRAKSLGTVLKEQWDLKVGTSRYGIPIQEVVTSLTGAMKTSRSMVIAFGSPKMGLREILAAERLAPNDAFNYFVNTAPDQQTLTVRTEEAILISLAILNLSRKLAV